MMPCEPQQLVPEREAPRRYPRQQPYVHYEVHPSHMTFYFEAFQAAADFARFYADRDGQEYYITPFVTASGRLLQCVYFHAPIVHPGALE